MILFLVISVCVNAALGYAAFNMLKKNESYEDSIQQFYSALTIVLHNMRILDEKKMFESDDEVGTVFQQLTDLVNELRPILYGVSDDNTTE